MRRGTWLLVLAALAVVGAGCGTRLGERCEADADCDGGLVCARPTVNDNSAAAGVCDYPLRGVDERCTVSAECAPTLTCANHFTPGDRYGTCVPQRGEGSACFVDRDCESGRCAGASGEALDGTCVPHGSE